MKTTNISMHGIEGIYMDDVVELSTGTYMRHLFFNKASSHFSLFSDDKNKLKVPGDDYREALEFIRGNIPPGCGCTHDEQCKGCLIKETIDEVLS